MQVIEDKELGRMVVRVNPRAKRFIFHTKSDAIYISVPSGATRKELDAAIESLRHKLKTSRKRIDPPAIINLDYRIDADFFKLSLELGTKDKFLAHSKPGEMKIICPPGSDFNDEALQKWLHKVIEEALRSNGKLILPKRLAMLSEKHGLPYQSVKINSSKGRWGSCSARRNINLSYYLMLLPQHLIDYVLLHELCHTLEMNHSSKFWAIMDRVTNGKSQSLREELKNYKTEI